MEAVGHRSNCVNKQWTRPGIENEKIDEGFEVPRNVAYKMGSFLTRRAGNKLAC